MRVRFLERCEIEVWEDYDEVLDDGETRTEIFQIGEETEFDLIDYGQRMMPDENGEYDLRPDPDVLNVQFGDGSVALGLSRSWFTVIVE